MFHKYFKMLKKLAFSFHLTTGLDSEDLFSEACLAYCQALESYDERYQTQLSTWITSCARNHLINYCNSEKRKNPKKYDILELPDSSMQTNPTPFFEFLDRLSPNGIRVVDLILEDKRTYGRLLKTSARRKVRHDLEQLGWKKKDIEKAIQELKLIFA